MNDSVENAAVPPPHVSSKPADVVEKGFDLVDAAPPPVVDEAPPAPPVTTTVSAPSIAEASDGGASSGSE